MASNLKIKFLFTLLALLPKPGFSEVCHPISPYDDSVVPRALQEIEHFSSPESPPESQPSRSIQRLALRTNLAPEDFLTNFKHLLYTNLDTFFDPNHDNINKKLGEDFEKTTKDFKERLSSVFVSICNDNPSICQHEDADFEGIWAEVSRNFRAEKRIELEIQNHFNENDLLSDNDNLTHKFDDLTAELKAKLHDEWWCSDTALCEDGEFETFWKKSSDSFRRKKLTNLIRGYLHPQFDHPTPIDLEGAKRLYRYFGVAEDFRVFESDEEFEEFYWNELVSYNLSQVAERERTRLELIESLIDLAKSTSHHPSASELGASLDEQSSLDFLLAKDLKDHDLEVQKRYETESQNVNFDCRVFWTKTENIFGDGAEVRGRIWMRPKTSRGRKIWKNISQDEINERTERVERLISLCEDVPRLKEISKQLAALDTEPSLDVLKLFEDRREVERFLHKMRNNEFGDDQGELDTSAINAHKGYKLAVRALPSKEEAQNFHLDENLKNQLQNVLRGGGNEEDKLRNLYRILQRDRYLLEVNQVETDGQGHFKTLERAKDSFLKRLSKQNPPILKLEDITDEMLEHFYNFDPRLQQIFRLNQSIDSSEPFRDNLKLNEDAGPLHSKEKAKEYFFAELIKFQKQELENVQIALSKINEDRDWSRGSRHQENFESLHRKKNQLLDHLKSLISLEEFNKIKDELESMDFAIKLAERISRPELSGKASVRQLDERTITWLPRILEDIGLRINEEKPKAIIESLNVIYELDESKLTIENLEKYFRTLLPKWGEMKGDDKKAILQGMQNQAKSEYLKKTRETLYNIDLVIALIQSTPSQYHMNQDLLLKALERRKRLLYRNLAKHFPEGVLNPMRLQIGREVAGYLRSLQQEAVPPPPGDIIKFATETANSFRDAAVNLLDIGLSIAPHNSLLIPFANWLTSDEELPFVDQQALRGEDVQYETNLLRSENARSWRADIDKKEVWQTAVFDLWLPAAFAVAAPVVSLTMDPLFNLPTSFLDNVVYGQAFGWNANEIYERRVAGDSSVNIGDNVAATVQAAIGFGMLLRGKTQIMERGRHFYRTGLKTPSFNGRLRPRSIIAGRTGNLTNRQAYALGATVIGGGSAALGYGLGAASVIAEEWYAASKDGRDINWARVFNQTYQSGGLSMAYMGGIGMFTERVFKNQLRAAERIPKGPARDIQIARVRQAQQRLAFKIDFIEGFMDAEHITDLFLEAESLDQYLAATLAASAVIYDSLGEQITSLSLRDGFYLIRNSGTSSAKQFQIHLPPDLTRDSEGSPDSKEQEQARERYENYRFERSTALFDVLSAEIPRISDESKSKVLEATEKVRAILSPFQTKTYTPAPGEGFDISQVYDAPILSSAKEELLAEYQKAGLSAQEAQKILDFVMSNHLIDDYQPPSPGLGQRIWENMNKPVF